jgi:Lysine methyltransferase
MKGLLILVLLVGRKSTQSWSAEPAFFTAAAHRHLVSAQTAHGADDAPSIEPTSIKWKGSTYSWVPPNPSRTSRKDMNGTRTAVVKRMSMQHCGAIEIEEHPADEVLDSLVDRTGVILWSAAYSIAEYIDVQCHARKSWNANHQNNQTIPSCRTCLELGAGLGLPSIVTAKHGWNCIATEHDRAVIPLLEKNVRRNNVLVASSLSSSPSSSSSSSPSVDQPQASFLKRDDESGAAVIAIESLDWTSSPDQVRALATKYPPADLIVASDLVYAQTRPVWKDLLSTINQLRSSWQQQQPKRQETTTTTSGAQLTAQERRQPLERFDGTFSSDGDPLVILGYTQRRRNLDIQGEREFFSLLHEVGMEAVMIPMDQVPNSDKRLLTILFELRWK